MTSHASHVYRGYRLQALYALYKILTAENVVESIFQPEGNEDLSVFDPKENLLETVQVKAYTSNLTLSDFSPEKPNSFMYRSSKLIETLPDIRISIVTYGHVGPELMNAIKNDGHDRETAVDKLSNYGFILKGAAKALFEGIELKIIDETTIKEEIYSRIRGSCAGVDPDAAFDLLNKWLYDCSENRERIKQQDIIDKILNVGNFLTDRATHLAEWGTTIVPIEDREIDKGERARLDKEFYYGVSTVYDHILADLDIIRDSRLQEISNGFDKTGVVIVHGASGQGKTALAYRYFHDTFPNQWRFRIRLIENRQHALSIATALNGHANAIGIPIAVYLDVTAKDADWPDFVREVSVFPQIRLLITIREEDWHRSTLSGTMMRFSEINLEFSEAEARDIYAVLTKRQNVSQFLGFDEAWRKYGGQGPLMEFVYLVTQGNTIRDRLAEQVERLKEEVRTGNLQQNELSLLRLTAVASAYEARLQAKPLVKFLGLSAPDRTLRYFEEEYLLRLSDDYSLLSGLHPIRSSILAELFSDPTFTPWIDSAKECIPYINEEDIEIFLLYSFLQRPEDALSLFNVIRFFHPLQWTSIAGVTRALIWYGLRQYVMANHNLISDLFQKYGSSWYMMLDFDIADASPGVADEIMGSIGSLLGNRNEAELTALRARQTKKNEIFEYTREWLSERSQEPYPPKTDSDWISMAESLIWVGKFNLSWPLNDWLPNIPFDKAIDELSLNILADVVYGLNVGCPTFFKMWMTNNRSRIIERFRHEGRIIAFEDDGQKVTAHFIVGFESGNLGPTFEKRINASKDRFHEETIIRINLMRKLLPDRQTYASQGYGHQILPENTPWDSTLKTGIDKKRFPSTCLTSINSTFRILANKEFRPDTWSEYAKAIFKMRGVISDSLLQLLHALENYFQSSKEFDFIGNYLNISSWDICLFQLKNAPLLPNCTLDGWGFVDESISDEAYSEVRSQITKRGLAIIQLRPFLDTLNHYVQNLLNYFNQAPTVMAVNSLLGRRYPDKTDKEWFIKDVEKKGINLKFGPLSTINLAEVVKIIPRMQLEFDRLLGPFIDKDQLDDQNYREQRLYLDLWNIWHVFVFQPEKITKNINTVKTWSYVALNKMRQLIKKELKKLSDDRCIIRIISEDLLWEGSPALWMTIDSKDVFKPFEVINLIAESLRKSIRNVPELQSQYIGLHWDEIVVIPLLQGKSLSGTAWRWALLSLLVNDELRWWQQIPLPVPPETLEQLKIRLWDNPKLEPAHTLLMSNSQLITYVKHIADFSRLPKEIQDKQSVAILQEYIKDYVEAQISHSFQTLLDSLTIIIERINNLNENIHDHPFLEIVAPELSELPFSDMLPSKENDGTYQVGLEDFVQWSKKLSEVIEIVMKVYLCWVSDVIGNTPGSQ
jgi:hypothetical protein